MIIYLAALVSVPPELYDAAEVDGAGISRKVWHVTLPHLRGIMLITLILQIIGTAQVFLEPYLFTDGGPDNATLTVLLLVYRYAFQNTTGGDYGKATALSLMLAVGARRALARLLPGHPAVVRVSALAAPDRSRRAAPIRPRADAERGRPRRAASPRRTSAAAGHRLAAPLLHGACWSSWSSSALGPLLWLAKSAITPTQDTLRYPLALWPNGIDWANLRPPGSTSTSSSTSGTPSSSRSARGSTQMLVAVTGGYALSVLRPRFAPGPLRAGPRHACSCRPSCCWCRSTSPCSTCRSSHWNLVNTYWGAFLPAGASAFNVALVKRFFDNLPREVIDAARVDGCGDFRLFWYVVLPMSRPVLGVVSVFAVLAAWKDFIWPLVVLPDPAKQPLSVRLPRLAGVTELDVVPGRPADLLRAADRVLPGLPAAVPARRAGGCGQGLTFPRG